MTPSHRLTRELLDSQAVLLPEALRILRLYLPRNATLVGQSIGKDIEWLQLREGHDYQVCCLVRRLRTLPLRLIKSTPIDRRNKLGMHSSL